MQLNNEKLYEALSQNLKTMYTVIELLSWNETSLGEIQGEVVGGNVSINGDSSVRRTLSIELAVTDSNYDILNIDNHIALNKKAKVKIGIETPDTNKITWFNLGVYLMTEANVTNDANGGATLGINAIDKMGMLNGDISGQIQTPVELHVSYDTYVEDGEIKYKSTLLTMDEIIRYAVVGLGGEDPARVIVNDVPPKIRSAVGYRGKFPMYLDEKYNPIFPDEGTGVAIHPEYGQLSPDNPPPGFKVIKNGDYIGYELTEFVYPGELVKQPGDTITSILDNIKGVLGNYEYFYDVDGNFIFQEIKNYRDKAFSTLTDLTNDDYIADFTKNPFVFSFKDKHIISTYTNTPEWRNIKNDFVVWGMPKSGSFHPVMYHLAIDKKPTLPPDYKEPWQKYLIDYGDNAILGDHPEGEVVKDIDPGRYYYELKEKFPQIYNLEETEENKKGWKEDYSKFTYYLDFIDTDSEFGKYSIDTIGKRTKSVVDDNVTIMYPPNVPDVIILLTAASEEEDPTLEEERLYLSKIGLQFIQIPHDRWGKDFISMPVGKDAFGVIRELLFYHTSYNESIGLSTIPMYFLDVNQLIEVEDVKSSIYGNFLIKSINLPLGIDGTMNIMGIRSTSRI